MCVTIDARILRAVADYRPSTELWALIDRCQREDLPALPCDPTDVPLYLVSVAPLSAEQAQAADEADAARWRVEQRISAMNTHRAHRAEDCGSFTIHLRRAHEAGGVEEMLARPPCGRTRCEYCMRQRLTRAYNRACAVILDAPEARIGGVGRLPRMGQLYVAETTWTTWQAGSVDRQMRRRMRDGGGWLRIRRENDSVLIVADRPFDDSQPLSPADTMDLTAAAIDAIHRDKHSFRTLGRWNVKRVKRWEMVQEYGRPFDLAAIHFELASLGVRANRWQESGFSALLWRAASDEAAAQLWASCPTLTNGAKASSKKTKSDTPGTHPWENDEEAIFGDDPTAYDPGSTPFG